MGKKADRRRTDEASSAEAADGNMSDKSFDRWFRRQVHRIYDETMAEPLPDSLVELLERFPSRRESAGSQPEERDDSEHT